MNAHSSFSAKKNIPLIALLLLSVWFIYPEILFSYWLNTDEGIYFHAAIKSSFFEMLKATVSHLHPPLYYAILWLMAALSENVSWLRSLSVVCALGSVLAAYLLGKEIGNRFGGFAATFFLVLSPAFGILGQIMRPYSMLCMWLLLAFLGALRYCKHSSPQGLRLFSWGMSLALLTHYSAVLLLPGALGAIVISKRSTLKELPVQKQLCGSLIWVFSTFLFISAVNLQFSLRNKVAQRFRDGYLAEQFPASSADIFALINESTGYLYSTSGSVLIVLFAALGIFAMQRSKVPFFPICIWLSLGFYSILGWLKLYPMGGSRHCFFLLPLFAVSLAHLAQQAASRRRYRNAALAVMLVVLGIQLSGNPAALRIKTALSSVSQHQALEELVLKRELVVQAIAALDSASQQADLLLIDQQAFYFFRPLFMPPTITVGTDGSVFWRGKLRVITSSSFITGYKTDVVAAIYKELENQAALIPGLATQKLNFLFLAAGWNIEDSLKQLDALAAASKIDRIIVFGKFLGLYSIKNLSSGSTGR